ncbi:hypothetical protein HaLaN_26829, partial [Haematococcus lacustris]
VNKQAKKRWPDRILAQAYGAAGSNGSGTIGCRVVHVSQMLKEAVNRVSSANNTPSETLPDTPPKSFRWLRPVQSIAKRSQVRGLMCSKSNDSIIRFYDRDASAALNIRRCAVGPGPRPTELMRAVGFRRCTANGVYTVSNAGCPQDQKLAMAMTD